MFASRLGLSRSRLYEILDEIKSHGAPIAYDKARQTFYYPHPFEICIDVSINSLDPVDEMHFNGGCVFSTASFFSGCYQNIFVA